MRRKRDVGYAKQHIFSTFYAEKISQIFSEVRWK
jgi:hypothetical protein